MPETEEAGVAEREFLEFRRKVRNESCLQRLDPLSQQLIARIVFQDYTLEEAAALLGCGRRTVVRRYPRALDRLSELFLEAELLRPFPCQEGEGGGIPASRCTARK